MQEKHRIRLDENLMRSDLNLIEELEGLLEAMLFVDKGTRCQITLCCHGVAQRLHCLLHPLDLTALG